MPDKLHLAQTDENADRNDSRLDESLFRAAVEQADIAISITDARARILYVNPAFTRATGYAPKDAIGDNQSILSNKTTPREVYGTMWQRITHGESWSGRLVNRRKDGRPYLADLTITPVTDASGKTMHFLGLHRDITELHKLECAVRNQKMLIESVVDGAPVVMALLDMEDHVVLDNHEYKKLMGDLGMTEPARVLLDAVRAEVGNGFGPFRVGEHAFLDRQVRIDRASWRSPRWFSCSGVWVAETNDDTDAFYKDEAHAYLLLVAKEITRQIMEQDKARVAALQAVTAEENRLQALRESLSAAIFKMEGPLNVVASVVNIMGRRGCDPAQAALAEALGAGQAALDMLRQAVPPIAPEEPASLNLNELVRDVLDLSAGRLLAAGISVSWTPLPALPSIQGYPTRLRTMFKGIVDNAIEAMNVKGWRERELFIGSCLKGMTVEVSVEDTGPGLPSDMRIKAFEPFFSTKKGVGSHMGTGLSSALQVAVDHGGNVDISDGQRGGCLVTVALPVRLNRE